MNQRTLFQPEQPGRVDHPQSAWELAKSGLEALEADRIWQQQWQTFTAATLCEKRDIDNRSPITKDSLNLVQALFDHIGRDTYHCAKSKLTIKQSWRVIACAKCGSLGDGKPRPQCPTVGCGRRVPRLYRLKAIRDMQYISLTDHRRKAVMVIDIDEPGAYGGRLEDLPQQVMTSLTKLASVGVGANLIGVNPETGKAQAIWLIDPVYSDGAPGKTNRPLTFYRSLGRDMTAFLAGDTHFSHSLSRNPAYTGNDPKAYRWWWQHDHVYSMRTIAWALSTLTDENLETLKPPSRYMTGRNSRFDSGAALISHAQKAARHKPEVLNVDTLFEDLEDTREVVEGVVILRTIKGEIARNETSFRHALQTTFAKRSAGQEVTDKEISEAWNHAYETCLKNDQSGRTPELLSLPEQQSLVDRIRRYTDRPEPGPGHNPKFIDRGVTGPERVALATLGRKGAKRSNEKRWADKDSQLAQNSLKPLTQTSRKRSAKGKATQARIEMFVYERFSETGKVPTWREIYESLELSRSTVARHLAALKKAGRLPT